MHFEDLFKKKYSSNSVNFNKKLNWFFDIKYLNFRKLDKKNVLNQAKQLASEYKRLINQKDNIKRKNKVIIKSKKFNNNLISNKIKNKKKILRSISFLKRNKFDIFFKFFLVQGSLSNNDFIDGWSDFDSFVVIKNDTILNYKKLIKLQKKLQKFYNLVLRYSPFQHHGVIIYTEHDLKNYKSGFLPPEALKENINIFRKEKINFYKIYSKKKLSAEILKQRNNYIKKSLSDGYYDHHVFNNKKMKVPFVENDQTLHQLFCHIGFMLNIPILFLDSIGKSSHKKNSFQKFYKIIKNKKIIFFIKKHEKLRQNWEKITTSKKKINRNLIKFLGTDYMKTCNQVINDVLKKIP